VSFSLRQIRYFVGVAEAGSVSGAAHELSVSQSTITEALQDLERDLGFPLIERHARGVRLTLKGQQFLRHARKIMADIADARRALTEDATPAVARIDVGVTPLVAGYVLADLLARFRRAFPQVAVTVTEDNRDYLEHLLVGGELDLAVVVLAGVPVMQGLQAEVIEASRSRVWLPLGHRLAGYETISLADIAREPQVLLSVDEIAERVESQMRRLGHRPTVSFRTRSVEAVRSLVATGAGVAVLPDLTYRPWSLEGDKIEARPLVEDLPPMEVATVWRRGSDLPASAQGFLRLAETRQARLR
jgi:DNA-binding transcriptional LysR family regulator